MGLENVNAAVDASGRGSRNPLLSLMAGGRHPQPKSRFATMNNILRKLGLLGITILLAITLALMSAHVERVGPDMVLYGNLCGATGSDNCYKPALRGGFPISYLFDAPGVSRERQLAFGEDNLQVGALAANIAVYFSILMLAVWGAWRRRSAAEREAE
jgi:hypothetical protein